MRNTTSWRAYRVGKNRRKVFILDGIVHPKDLRAYFIYFRELPYFFSSYATKETSHTRYLSHSFPNWNTNPILSRLHETVADFLKKRRLPFGDVLRVYSNANQYGTFQYAHNDGHEWTALYFANHRWKEDWGGEITFYDDDPGDPAFSIAPRPGRLIIFDGNLDHRAGVPSKLCPDPRISVAIRFARPV